MLEEARKFKHPYGMAGLMPLAGEVVGPVSNGLKKHLWMAGPRRSRENRLPSIFDVGAGKITTSDRKVRAALRIDLC